MSENMNLIVGLLVSIVPLFVVGYLMLNRQPPIFRMFVAMLAIGVGYLWATGAVEDIGAQFTGKRIVVPAENATTPAASKPAAAEAPKAAPEAPKAAPAPAEAPKEAAPPAGAAPADAH